MKHFWQKLTSQIFWRDRVILTSIFIMLIFNIASWLTLVFIEKNEAIVPWHYTVYFGIDRVGPWWRIGLYPLFGSLVGLFNFFLSVSVFYQRRLFAYIIMIVANLVQIILFLQVIGLVLFVI